MIEIPTTEPLELVAGDSWQWRREDLVDYPAPTWTLVYRFKNASGGFEITAAADGAEFAISVPSATTATYAAGVYQYAARVSDGTTFTTVREGAVTLTASLFAGTASAALDLRSDAQKGLDAINAALLAKATNDQMEYEISIGGSARRIRRCSIPELLQARAAYQADVWREQAAQRIADGYADPRREYVRFLRA